MSTALAAGGGIPHLVGQSLGDRLDIVRFATHDGLAELWQDGLKLGEHHVPSDAVTFVLLVRQDPDEQ